VGKGKMRWFNVENNDLGFIASLFWESFSSQTISMMKCTLE